MNASNMRRAIAGRREGNSGAKSEKRMEAIVGLEVVSMAIVRPVMETGRQIQWS